MGFREILKSELTYSGMLVRELANRTGISKYTLDNYLNDNGRKPTAEAAMKIARVLGVSMEYLVTGKEGNAGPCAPTSGGDARKEMPLSPESRAIIQSIEKLPESERKIILSTVNALTAALKSRK
jgi:transcriptional regulator with XRE-family HTH domain